MTPESKNVVAALRNILIKLELMAVPGRDEESLAELKRILNERIDDLENYASIPAIAWHKDRSG